MDGESRRIAVRHDPPYPQPRNDAAYPRDSRFRRNLATARVACESATLLADRLINALLKAAMFGEDQAKQVALPSSANFDEL